MSIISNIINIGTSMRKRSWLGKLFDKNDTSVALSSVLIGLVGFVVIILLMLPVFAMSIEVWYNHTISSDINGWAAFIGAVGAILGIIVGGKVGINYADNKFTRQNESTLDNTSYVDETVSENEDEIIHEEGQHNM